MSPQEMANLCATSINSATEFGLPIEEARIVVVLPKGWKPPPKFPRRTLLSVNQKNERVYQLSAVNVLAWLMAHRLAAANIRVLKEENDGP